MIPAKEKAIDLYNEFYNTSSHPHHVESRKQIAKQCAIIAVKELLKISIWTNDALYDYFMEVRQEIEKL